MQAGLLQSWIWNRSFFHNSFSLRLFNLNHIMSVLGNFEQANVPIPEQKKDPNKPKGARLLRNFLLRITVDVLAWITLTARPLKSPRYV